VGAAAVGPEDPLAEMDDVRRLVRPPRLAAQPAALLGLGLERLLVSLPLAVGHLVRLAPLDHEAAFGELGVHVGLHTPSLLDGTPEGDRVGLAKSGHAGHSPTTPISDGTHVSFRWNHR